MNKEKKPKTADRKPDEMNKAQNVKRNSRALCTLPIVNKYNGLNNVEKLF